jgi:hypothetical protein
LVTEDSEEESYVLTASIRKSRSSKKNKRKTRGGKNQPSADSVHSKGDESKVSPRFNLRERKPLKSYQMIGIIWNCRGVAKKGISTYIKELIWDHKVDFIGIQETKKKSYSDNFFRKLDNAKEFSWHWTPSSGKSRGMLSGIKNDRFDVESFDIGDYMIIANVFDKNLKKHWSLANIFLSELSNFCFKPKYPILMGGDFNILRYSSEKNKKFNENNFSSVFNLIINAYELRELPHLCSSIVP